MSIPQVTHASFTVERTYPHPPARVFRAHSDKAAVRRWRIEGEGFHIDKFELDFREGGREHSTFRYGDGPAMTFDGEFHVIIPDRRMVSTYAMTLAGEPLSVSLLTIEIAPEGTGTRLTLTEQGTYFGDPDAAVGREAGMRELLDALAKELDGALV